MLSWAGLQEKTKKRTFSAPDSVNALDRFFARSRPVLDESEKNAKWWKKRLLFYLKFAMLNCSEREGNYRPLWWWTIPFSIHSLRYSSASDSHAASRRQDIEERELWAAKNLSLQYGQLLANLQRLIILTWLLLCFWVVRNEWTSEPFACETMMMKMFRCRHTLQVRTGCHLSSLINFLFRF